ncbi:MAG: transcription termination/antitermination factor NusG [Bacteroidetes bacterium]|jgi:transcription termination/antitermination protein NusG|nr:MAG: transcription termination/antitermination factor NusG [Bacteroidota bacterium]TAF93439.1 MAG: transcription termination/antitermination factor NusG [Bacteroidota bacterium]
MEEIVVQQQDTRWFVLRVVSGKERKVKEQLDKEVSRNGWTSYIKQVFLPMEKVYKVQNGKKVMREKNYFPGYVMLEVVPTNATQAKSNAERNLRSVASGETYKKEEKKSSRAAEQVGEPVGLPDDIIQYISNVSNVMHFLTDGSGSKGKIMTLRRSEVNKMLGRVDEMNDQGVSISEPFIVGETIKIIEGPFNDFNGVIEEVHDEKKKLKVSVKIFGRSTPVELNYIQVEKLG